MAHVAWHGLTLTSFLMRGIGTDDRAPRLDQPTVIEREPWGSGDGPIEFLCGHSFGDEPSKACGTAIHWSRVNGIPRDFRYDERVPDSNIA